MIERYHLSIVRAVSRQGTLTDAAKVLHLTQPALSHAIKKLEQQLNTPLWRKEGRHLRLTPAGEYLLGLANRLLPQFEHAEQVIGHIAEGRRGILRIGMECHPCYQWLLKVVAPYLKQWPDVDVDVIQKFQFGGIGALFAHDIDILVTPDPLLKPGLRFDPVFDYEQVLVVSESHHLAARTTIEPDDLSNETLITYPVDTERLDIFSHFLSPAQRQPRKHKVIETTEIMLQMVAANRGVAALPNWLVQEYAARLGLRALRLGESGVAKSIYLGYREADRGIDFLASFLLQAKQ